MPFHQWTLAGIQFRLRPGGVNATRKVAASWKFLRAWGRSGCLKKEINNADASFLIVENFWKGDFLIYIYKDWNKIFLQKQLSLEKTLSWELSSDFPGRLGARGFVPKYPDSFHFSRLHFICETVSKRHAGKSGKKKNCDIRRRKWKNSENKTEKSQG